MQVYLAFLPVDAESMADSWLNRLVGRMAGQKNAMVHCELVFKEDPDDLYSMASSIHYGGEVFVRDKLFSRAGWHFRQISMQQEMAEKCLRWCKSKEGGKFNYVGFYGRGIPFFKKCLPRPQNRWFCSELVCACLRENGVMDIQTCTPHELFERVAFTSCPSHPKVKHMELSL